MEWASLQINKWASLQIKTALEGVDFFFLFNVLAVRMIWLLGYLLSSTGIQTTFKNKESFLVPYRQRAVTHRRKLLGKSLDFEKAELTQLLQYAVIFF